jgi:hypothetical protein
MTKRSYGVIAILPGRSKDYYDFWSWGRTVNKKGEALHPAMLAESVMVEAKNKKDAEALVKKSHPKHSIDSAATFLYPIGFGSDRI